MLPLLAQTGRESGVQVLRKLLEQGIVLEMELAELEIGDSELLFIEVLVVDTDVGVIVWLEVNPELVLPRKLEVEVNPPASRLAEVPSVMVAAPTAVVLDAGQAPMK